MYALSCNTVEVILSSKTTTKDPFLYMEEVMPASTLYANELEFKVLNLCDNSLLSFREKN